MAACSFDGSGIDFGAVDDAGGEDAPEGREDAAADVADAAVDPDLPPDVPVPACLPGYAGAGVLDKGCYRFVTDTRKWLEAESACEADGAGAHLVVIDDLAEYQAILEEMDGLEDEAWVGGSDRRTEGTFLTVTGGPLLQLWQPGAPSEGGNAQAEDCGIIENHERALQGLNDENCNKSHTFFCEHDGIAADPTAF